MTKKLLCNYAGDLYVHYPGADLIVGAVAFINSNAFSRAVISNFAMTGMHTEPTQTTNFEGALDTGGIKVNIEDGMNVGDYIYIPMAPSPILEYGNFAGIPFEFTFADGTKYTKYIQGSKTEMGNLFGRPT